MMVRPILTSVALGTLLTTPRAFTQPDPYAPHGTRAMLINYGAINGDRFLAQFAARRFALVDEGSPEDIRAMRRESPTLPVLQYKDMVAVYSSWPDYDSLAWDEGAFLHAADPAGLVWAASGTVRLGWLPDRRFEGTRVADSVVSYDVQGAQDSAGAYVTLQAGIATNQATLAASAAAPWLRIATRTRTGREVPYSLPVHPVLGPDTGLTLMPVAVTPARATGRGGAPDTIVLTVAVRARGPAPPARVRLLADTNFNRALDTAREAFPMTRDAGDTTIFRRTLRIPVATTYRAGVMFTVRADRGASAVTLPRAGSFTSNPNNRLCNGTYGFYVMNVCSGAWCHVYVDQVRRINARVPYNGLFEDDCWSNVWPGSAEAWPPVAYASTAWLAGIKTMMDTIAAAVAPMPTYFNGLGGAPSDQLLAHATGGMTEGFVYATWWGARDYPEKTWMQGVSPGLYARTRSGRQFLALAMASRTDLRRRLYALGSFWLIADSGSFYACADVYQNDAHLPEFDIPMGGAIDPLPDSLPALRTTDSVYQRRFANGRVIVNASDSARTAHVGAGFWRTSIDTFYTQNGGRVTTSPAPGAISLQPHEAAILLTGFLESPRIARVTLRPDPLPADGATEIGIDVVATDRSTVARDTARPLRVELDAGDFGGPQRVVLDPVNDSLYHGTFRLPEGSGTVGVLTVSAWSTTGLIAVTRVAPRIAALDPSNLLRNPGFEMDVDSDGTPDGWEAYQSGYDYDTTTVDAHRGTASVRCADTALAAMHGVVQRVTLNENAPAPLVVSGWSRAQGVGGSRDQNYAVYVDFTYADGTTLYGQAVQFTTGTHDWEFQRRVVIPAKPIRSANFYLLFRRHRGTVWFDDVRLSTDTTLAGVRLGAEGVAPQAPEVCPTVVPAGARALVRCVAARELLLCDVLGRAVRRWGPVAAGEVIAVPTMDLAAGTYRVVAHTPRGAASAPFCVVR